MAGSFGKMPTTLVRRLISALSRSSGLVRVDLHAMRLREAHEGEHVGFGIIHERGELGELRAQLIGDRAPLRDRRLLAFPARTRC